MSQIRKGLDPQVHDMVQAFIDGHIYRGQVRLTPLQYHQLITEIERLVIEYAGPKVEKYDVLRYDYHSSRARGWE